MCDKPDFLSQDYWDKCIRFKVGESPPTWLHCLPDQRLKQGDEVVVTCGSTWMLRGTVESRFPNLPRRLRIRTRTETGEVIVTRTFGCLPDPEYVGTKYEIRVLRVVGKTVARYRHANPAAGADQ